MVATPLFPARTYPILREVRGAAACWRGSRLLAPLPLSQEQEQEQEQERPGTAACVFDLRHALLKAFGVHLGSTWGPPGGFLTLVTVALRLIVIMDPIGGKLTRGQDWCVKSKRSAARRRDLRGCFSRFPPTNCAFLAAFRQGEMLMVMVMLGRGISWRC